MNPKRGSKFIQVKLNSVSLDFCVIFVEECSNRCRYLSQPSGPDLVTEVPLSRWDVDQYFDPEAPWPVGRARHGFGICGSSLNHEQGVCLVHVCAMFPTREESHWKQGKTIARHGSFVEGTEYFDNKFFGLSPMEAKAYCMQGNGYIQLCIIEDTEDQSKHRAL